MEVAAIERGWTVYTEDDKRVGDVVEVHPHYLLVSRGLVVVRDVYVPRYAVASAENRRVRLAISEARLRKMGWTSPPPAPPAPADSPAPRLVPTPVPDEPAQPLFPPSEAAAPEPEPAWSFDEATTTESDEPYLDDYEDMGIVVGPTVEIDGDTHLRVQKIGDGPAVVLIHGWGFDRRIWDAITLDLPRDHTVVTYDARGYGASTAPWSGYDVERAGRDLRVIIRTLELRDATLVGLDVGAAAALQYALSGGQRAGRLVLIAPVVPPSGNSGDELAARVETWRDGLRRDRPSLASTLVDLWAPGASAQTRDWLRVALLAAAPYALMHGLDALARPDVGGALEAMTLPAVILHARQDPVIAYARSAAAVELMPNARLVALDTVGHLPMVDDPERIAAEIRRVTSDQ